MNGSYGAGTGAGLAIGLAIGEMRRAEEEAEGKRKSEEGKDQILIKARGGLEKVGSAIASIYSDWRWNEGRIEKDYGHSFDWGYAFIGGLVVGVGIMFFGMAWNAGLLFECKPYSWSCGWPITFLQWIEITAIAVVISGVLGFFTSPWVEVSGISMSEHEGNTLVLIKIYDSSGNRNIDEDTIYRIFNALRKTGAI